MMVNLAADNGKLRHRAAAIVRQIAGTDDTAAAHALSAAHGDIKHAILIAAGAATPETARRHLEEHDGNLRDALVRLRAE
jgi:N-acetylmuramic acid 6-phosphate etherase